ncbi:AAA family ATPase [Roseibacterium sp. SDUM158017]|uniref:bifunctional aminoglycoside phosphotransferase/ATP-binding protein n=1 Tax=Roseicyclus salinarum TaxID=3036773 RepID=UPI002415087C|nr:bifunctional aminoglycoside phosphotransferase/ATP-binding protein [Roseibacterium sp. SDUM158017]MDG4648443.1 AAA family ATPase [Roseibacterium sp. SDUM158017]
MTQAKTVAFLASGRAFPGGGPVEVIETHGAYVFLCGDTALKLKREVKYDYMDLSTVALRRKLVARELELNRPAAPEIYRDMLPVTRGEAGLELGGAGAVVDWVLRMWRFPAENELERVVARGELDDRLATSIGEAVAAYHAKAPAVLRGGRALLADILAELGRVFAGFEGAAGTGRLAAWQGAVAARLRANGALLDARARDGHLRRAHGDLHLRNLVLIDGRPVLYDALEFDETLGTCDVLYDIAFLVMDLCHRGLRRQACRVLDAWLRAARGTEDGGLAALPLFLSVRAAIRAMVLLQTDAARGCPGTSAPEVADYLDLACAALDPVPARLVAVGGLSGSGKSVLARALAPLAGPLPGAVLLGSDLERKAGRPAGTRLDSAAYARERREAVYLAMLGRAATLLAAGHSVILDATFLDPAMRARAEDVAKRAGRPFVGFWLEAPDAVLRARLRARRGDASDADVAVLERQIAAGAGQVAWCRLDAGRASGDVFADAAARLGADRGANAG